MAKLERVTAGQNGTPDRLRAHIEELAVSLVLGNTGGTERLALLAAISQEAEALARLDVAQIAAAALEAASMGKTAGEVDALLSDCATRMQQVLGEGSETGCESSGQLPAAAAAPAGTSSAISLGEDRDLLRDFVLECRDHLTEVEVQMITLEKDPADCEAINTVFRAFHTIKGLAGFLDLGDMREVAHETETLLDLARNRKLSITPAVVDIVLAAADFQKAWLLRVENTMAGCDRGPAPEKALLLERIRRGTGSDAEDLGYSPHAQDPPAASPCDAEDNANTSSAARPGAQDVNSEDQRNGEGRRTHPPESVCVKVDTAKLDYLVDMAGEMVIAESMVRHHPELAALHSPAVLHSLAQLARITSDLQKTAMSMRMVPIGGLFQKMNRMVRDLARKTGKQARMEAVGSDTELDRNIVEELADPLMHMVRNAIDHGLEAPEERLAAGKNPTGCVRLRACHQAGHIVIEIADDGGGLCREKILDKARRTGLIENGSSLSDSEVFDLIFHPGFSTAVKVTDVSGRGVGMDVVKKRIQKLRGHIEIESRPGLGTTFFLRLPLTLAIIDGLAVGVGDERYVVPIFSVREMLRPTAEMVFTVEGRQEMALVRNALLPVVRLHQRFGVRPRSEKLTESLLIVAEAAGRFFCLMVDDLIGKQEVVIKSLGEMLKDIPGVAGGAILGDGRVGLILDLEGIFRGRTK